MSNNGFHVEFRACPTNHNPMQFLHFTAEELRNCVCLERDRAEFTEHARRKHTLNAHSYVIERIYSETPDKIIEYYKYNYRVANTVTEALRTLINPPKKVVSADDEESK